MSFRNGACGQPTRVCRAFLNRKSSLDGGHVRIRNEV